VEGDGAGAEAGGMSTGGGGAIVSQLDVASSVEVVPAQVVEQPAVVSHDETQGEEHHVVWQGEHHCRHARQRQAETGSITNSKTVVQTKAILPMRRIEKVPLGVPRTRALAGQCSGQSRT
jgi:hypothetical protein